MATRRNRAVTRCPLARCCVYAANTSSASGKRHLPPGWSERRDLFAWVAALRILISPAAHFDTRLLFTPNRLASCGEAHWPASFLCCSRRNSSTTCSLNAKVRATRRSPSRRPLRFGMPSLRSFAARIRESQRKTARIVQSPGAYRWPSSDDIAVVSLESGRSDGSIHVAQNTLGAKLNKGNPRPPSSFQWFLCC